MIGSFGSKDTERIWHEQYVKGVDRMVQRATLRKLELIHAAKDVEDLRIPPGNRLERLVGERADSTASEPTRNGESASFAEMEVRTMSN